MGLSSYLLIGHWWEKDSAADAGKEGGDGYVDREAFATDRTDKRYKTNKAFKAKVDRKFKQSSFYD